MQGYNVLHPMGWDAFGLPAENEAIKKGRNPRDDGAASMPRTIAAQLQMHRRVATTGAARSATSEPDYYRWTQWFFLLLYKRGLAYRARRRSTGARRARPGWPTRRSMEGRCWRCDTLVEQAPMPQWFFRITEYAERLLDDLDTDRLARGHQAHAAQLDRPQRRRRGATSRVARRCDARRTVASSPPGPTRSGA